MEIKPVFVGIKYQINLGYVARVLSNFGYSSMHLVKPRAKVGKTAIKYSKHGVHIFKNMVEYNSLDEAVEDCDIVVGTTGIWEKAKSAPIRLELHRLREFLKKRKVKRVALVIGRDDTGLSAEEVRMCDIAAFIDSSESYPVLNISHALAIFLYCLSDLKGKEESEEMPNREELKLLLEIFEEKIKRRKVRNKESIIRSFRKIIISSSANKKDVHALITALK
ncbi:MAG: RNA methyltransferase [Candidatus Micrarchaeaceae archaeon]